MRSVIKDLAELSSGGMIRSLGSSWRLYQEGVTSNRISDKQREGKRLDLLIDRNIPDDD